MLCEVDWPLVSEAQGVSVGVLFESGTHSALQLFCKRPGERVQGEHVKQQSTHGRAWRRGQRGRPLKLHWNTQLEVGVLPKSFSQGREPAASAHERTCCLSPSTC